MCNKIIFHAADVSNAAKPFNLAFAWGERAVKEFWNQVLLSKQAISYLKKKKGDKERE